MGMLRVWRFQPESGKTPVLMGWPFGLGSGVGKEKLSLQTPYPNIIQNLCALLGIYLTFARRLIP